MDVLKFHPFLIKPNIDELRDIFGEAITAEDGASMLQAAGARDVIVSMGRRRRTAHGRGRQTLQSGSVQRKDAELRRSRRFHGGRLCRRVYMEKNDYQYALDLGSAAGSATAFSPGTCKEAEDR